MRRKQAMPYRWPYILEKQVTLIPKPSQYQWLWVLSSNRFLHILASVTFCSHIAIVLHQQLQIVFLQTRLASVEHAMLIGLGCRMTFAPATCPCKKKMTLHSGAMVWSWHARGKTSNVSHSCPLWTTTHLHLWIFIPALLLEQRLYIAFMGGHFRSVVPNQSASCNAQGCREILQHCGPFLTLKKSKMVIAWNIFFQPWKARRILWIASRLQLGLQISVFSRYLRPFK